MMLSLLTVAFAADLELTVSGGVPLDPLIAQPYEIRRYTHDVSFQVIFGGGGGAGGAAKGPLTLVRDADLLSPSLFRLQTYTDENALWTLTTFDQETSGARRVRSTLEFQVIQGAEWKLVMGPMGIEEQLTIDYGRYRRCEYDLAGVPVSCSSWDFLTNQETW